ncbi:E3 ubiquitin-protein ligase ZFP91 isoform X1 [Folsomia candida]|uniref:E3 ubiquitin-protein ligase ZFP91 isoform X1 n=1 Tax=Folsomia candida TaxID=158441 RepID=UPI000B904F2B|nr:E3 ubiquitin-protein ligase ZFP91 isoform X1 [Folsomia candida]
MSNQFCLVCLQNLAKGGDDDKKEEEDSTIRKIPILTLFQSLGRGRSKSSYQDEFAEEETCKLCPNCYPVLSEVEEIRNQIVLLEEQVVRKIGQVRDTISISASLKRGDDGDEKVKRIRKIILQVLDSLQSGDDEQDSAFSITPSLQKKQRGRPKSTKNTASRKHVKRPRESSSPTVEASELESRTPIYTKRSSPRLKTRREQNSLHSSENEDDNLLYQPPWCFSCRRTFLTESNLNRHNIRYHLVPCPVPSCNTHFRTKEARHAHLKLAHEDFHPHQCQICAIQCKNLHGLAIHLGTRHQTDEKNYPATNATSVIGSANISRTIWRNMKSKRLNQSFATGAIPDLKTNRNLRNISKRSVDTCRKRFEDGTPSLLP